MERKEIGIRLTALGEAVNETLTPLRIDLYLQALADLPFEALKGALEKMLTTCRWFPKIPDIREAVLGKPEEIAKDAAQLEAERAWEKVLYIAGHWGIDEETHEFMPIYSKGKALFPPVLTAAENYALRQIGWYEAIDRQDPEKMTWMRRDFMAAHKRFIETAGLKQIPAGAAEMLAPGLAPQLTVGMQSLGQMLKSKQ